MRLLGLSSFALMLMTFVAYSTFSSAGETVIDDASDYSFESELMQPDTIVELSDYAVRSTVRLKPGTKAECATALFALTFRTSETYRGYKVTNVSTTLRDRIGSSNRNFTFEAEDSQNKKIHGIANVIYWETGKSSTICKLSGSSRPTGPVGSEEKKDEVPLELYNSENVKIAQISVYAIH